MPGPTPKRSSERRRRNKPDTPIRQAPPLVESVAVPEAPGGCHERAVEWFESLKVSGQSVFYEPSDWEAAKLTALLITEYFKKPSAFMWMQVWNAMGDLGTTESARRKQRIEVERDAPEQETPPGVTAIAEFRKKASG